MRGEAGVKVATGKLTRRIANGPPGAAPNGYFIVGMTNSAPARIPVGQREVIVFSRE